MEQLFGRQGAVEVTMIMADYAMAGFILTAVDQQLPPDRKPLCQHVEVERRSGALHNRRATHAGRPRAARERTLSRHPS